MHTTQTKHVKYLGLHLDTQLTWKLNSKSIIEKIQKTRRQTHWLTSRKSKLSIENNLKIYKTIIKPIWTYGITLWGIATMSHINKIETIQAKVLSTIVNAPWYIRNEDIRRDLEIPTVKEAISSNAERYKVRIATHPNRLAAETFKTINIVRRLKRMHPADLTRDMT